MKSDQKVCRKIGMAILISMATKTQARGNGEWNFRWAETMKAMRRPKYTQYNESEMLASNGANQRNSHLFLPDMNSLSSLVCS